MSRYTSTTSSRTAWCRRLSVLLAWLCGMAVSAQSDEGRNRIGQTGNPALPILTADSLRETPIVKNDSVADSKFSKWIPDEMELQRKLPLFQGFTISADVFGLGMYLLGDYGTIEAALRLSLKNTYLPIVELGYGLCEHTDYNTKIHFKVNAPFIRLGIDYNLLKNKFQDNRMFVGLHWGFSTYKYDMDGPDLIDPVYGGMEPFNFDGTAATSHWFELVLGCQVKILKNFHMGWTVRLKYHLSSSTNENSKAYYIPGYGTTGNSNTWSGSYNLIFDLNWGKKRPATTSLKE